MNPRPRCLLFCPGHRPDRFDKALASGAAGVVLDLEDGVGHSEKSVARRNVLDWLSHPTQPARPQVRGHDAPLTLRPLLALRINPPRTAEGLEDLYAWTHAEGLPTQGWLLVPKVEDAGELAWLAAHIARKAAGWRICALIETGRGLRELPRTAGVTGLASVGFGGADLATDLALGDGFEALWYVRSRFVVDASGHGLHLMDVPHLALNEHQALQDECVRVRALGFGGKFAIHPSQVAVIDAAFAPAAAAVAAARRVVQAFEAGGGQAVRVDGQMIDEPVYQRALATLASVS